MKLFNFIFNKKNLIIYLIILTGFIIFIYSYWINLYRPAALESSGWYAIWADQRRYYEQARAISNLTLDEKTFHYPILYPFLGSIFINVFSRDPFLIINIIFFLITLVVLYKLIEKIFGKVWAFGGVFILLSTSRFIYDFVTPWTTSITTPLFIISFYILYVCKFSTQKLIFISSLAGLTLLTRGADIIFFLPLIVGFILKNKSSLPQKFFRFLYSGGILSCFLFIFVILNKVTTNTLLGPYIQRNVEKFGFTINPLTIYEKIMGYFVNSFIYHQQTAPFSTPLLQTFPLTIIFLTFSVFLIYSLSKEDRQKKIIHLSLMSSFIIWLIIHFTFNCCSAFTLKNLSLHYFKPWYPLIIFCTILSINYLSKIKILNKKLIFLLFSPVLVLILVPILVQFLKPQLLDSKNWKIITHLNTQNIQNVIDKNADSFWIYNSNKKTGEVLTFDLKHEFTINRLQILDKDAFTINNFDIFLSKDLKNWIKLAPDYTYNIRVKDAWNALGYMKKARYVRILNNESSNSEWIIREIYAFGY